MTEPNPTVRAQELGEELRRLRETTDLSLEEAAARIDASASKLSRIETGRRPAPPEDVTALLTLYGVTGQQRRELLALTRESDQRGWWQRDRPDFPERQRTLISLESRAHHIVNFEGMLIPGLLQTGEYARNVIRRKNTRLSEQDVENRMTTRCRRHSALVRRDPPVLIALIDELALHRSIGGSDVLRRQLEHLLKLIARPNITIRVVPNAEGHAGITGGFSMIDQYSGPTVVFVEAVTCSLFIEGVEEIKRYRQVVHDLLTDSLDPTESAELIANLATRSDTEAPSHELHRLDHVDLAKE